MNYKPLQIGDLIAERPIVQGGMGVGISLGNLAGAVAKEGGVGIISSAQIGFKEEDFENNPRLANKKAIKKEYEKARRISPNGIIGFNIMVALKDYREHVIEAAKAGADIIVSGAGLPTELPEYLKGFKTKMAPIVSSVKSAKVILKYWDRRHNATADMIIIEGPKAGGHLGFSVEELESELDYDNEIQGIIDVVKEYEKKYNKDIPVVVAGGISDKNKVKHAFDLGAQGVQVATRFVPTKECDADENYKKEDLQRENHSHKSDSTKDVTAKVPDENDKNFENKKEVYLNEPDNIDNKHTNIDSKSTTNNDRLPKTGTVSEVFMSLVAGIMFTLGAFLGLKKKDQD